MTSDTYIFYILIASLTIASPGPGVVLTIANTINYGLKSSVPGIIGVSIGMFIISIISASGVGVIISSSELIFNILKYCGAAYLAYLGVKLWRSDKKIQISPSNPNTTPSVKDRFLQGFYITLSNPKPIVFFIALFPQFVNYEESYIIQFSILSLTFCFLIILIHLLYGVFSNSVRGWISKKGGIKIINRSSGLCFWVFSALLVINK